MNIFVIFAIIVRLLAFSYLKNKNITLHATFKKKQSYSSYKHVLWLENIDPLLKHTAARVFPSKGNNVNVRHAVTTLHSQFENP